MNIEVEICTKNKDRGEQILGVRICDETFEIAVANGNTMWNHGYQTSIQLDVADAKKLRDQLNIFIGNKIGE